jgi:hypothetical protein
MFMCALISFRKLPLGSVGFRAQRAYPRKTKGQLKLA